MKFKHLVALVVSLAILVSCMTAVLAETAPTIITVWSNDAHSKDIMTKAVEDFNANEGKELGIQVELSVYGTDYYSTLDIALSADEAPYIFKCNKIPSYARAGIYRNQRYPDGYTGDSFPVFCIKPVVKSLCMRVFQI